MTVTRAPAACPICYARHGLGIAARAHTHGMVVCDHHAAELREGRPITDSPLACAPTRGRDT